MFRRFDYYLAGLLCILLVGSGPARAESVGWTQVEQIQRTKMNGRDGRRSPELRLAKNLARSNGKNSDAKTESGKDKKSNSKTNKLAAKDSDSLLPKTDVVSQGKCSGTNVEQVDLCDVTGTVCEDCGEVVLVSEVLPEFAEVPHAGGGFPNIPLYALVAIPIAFLPLLRSSDKKVPPQLFQPNTPETNVTPVVTPIPPSTPEIPTTPTTPVPEPASMLLLGSGLAALGAAARRRRRRHQEISEARVESLTLTSSSEVL